MWTLIENIIEWTRVSILSSLLMLHILWSNLLLRIDWIKVVLRSTGLNRWVIPKSTEVVSRSCYTVVRFVSEVLNTLLIVALIFFCPLIESCKVCLPF